MSLTITQVYEKYTGQIPELAEPHTARAGDQDLSSVSGEEQESLSQEGCASLSGRFAARPEAQKQAEGAASAAQEGGLAPRGDNMKKKKRLIRLLWAQRTPYDLGPRLILTQTLLLYEKAPFGGLRGIGFRKTHKPQGMTGDELRRLICSPKSRREL